MAKKQLAGFAAKFQKHLDGAVAPDLINAGAAFEGRGLFVVQGAVPVLSNGTFPDLGSLAYQFIPFARDAVAKADAHLLDGDVYYVVNSNGSLGVWEVPTTGAKNLIHTLSLDGWRSKCLVYCRVKLKKTSLRSTSSRDDTEDFRLFVVDTSGAKGSAGPFASSITVPARLEGTSAAPVSQSELQDLRNELKQVKTQLRLEQGEKAALEVDQETLLAQFRELSSGGDTSSANSTEVIKLQARASVAESERNMHMAKCSRLEKELGAVQGTVAKIANELEAVKSGERVELATAAEVESVNEELRQARTSLVETNNGVAQMQTGMEVLEAQLLEAKTTIATNEAEHAEMLANKGKELAALRESAAA